MTIASLGLAVDSSSVISATPALEKMAAASSQAEVAAKRLTGAVDAGSVAQTRGAATAKMEAVSLEAEAVAARMATSAHGAHGAALGNSTGQIMALTHVARSMTEQLAMGVPVTQALTGQFSHMAYIISAPGGLMGALKGVGGLLAPFLPVIIGIGVAVGAVVGVFAGLTTKINETAKTHVSFGNVFIATIQVAAESIGKFFKPAVEHLGSWWQRFVDWITPLFKNVTNGIIGSFVFAFNAVKDTWSLLPDAFASIFTKAMNGAIDIVQNGINAIIGPVNNLLATLKLPTVPTADLSQFKGTPSNADQKVGGIISADATAAFSTDYAGQAFNAISQKAQQLALADAAAKAGKETKKTSDLLKGPLTDGIDKLTAKANVFADAITGAFSNMGTTLVDAFKKGGDVAGNVLNSLLDKVGQLGESLLNSGLNSLLNSAVSSIFAPATGGAWGNGLWGSAIFGHNAAGTNNWRGGMTWVGEQGPELVNLPGGSQVIPNGQSMAMAANQNGGNTFSISVTVNADSTTNGASVARQVSQELRRQVPDLVAASQRNPYRRSA